MSAAIVVPVHLIVSGIGLERLTSSYRTDVERAEQVIPTIVSFFVIAPLVAAAVIHMLQAISARRRPDTWRCLQASLDDFAPLFLAILFTAAGVAVGLIALILPGIYLLIRWFFVAQCVVIEDKRGFDALARSGQLVRDNWWRVLRHRARHAADRRDPGAADRRCRSRRPPTPPTAEALSLAGDMAASVLTVPFVAVVTTLLFYDLRARREALAA